MKIQRYWFNNYSGFALIELLMVFVIIGSLASIAIPHYGVYRERALAAQCQTNRYHIELEERGYFVENDKPNLVINDKYTCPSGGTYVWLVLDPDDQRYPQIGCSIHFTGSLPETITPTPETATPETPAPVKETPEETSPVKLIDNLITYVYNLNLGKGLENSFIAKLNSAETAIGKDRNDQAIKSLDNFLKQVKSEEKKGNIAAEEAGTMISMAEKIKGLL